jgi:hypothetical protein
MKLTPAFIGDYGDFYDKQKYGSDAEWDFREDNIPVYYIENDPYPYKARSKKSAKILSNLRKHITQTCRRIEDAHRNGKISAPNQEYIDGVDIFLGIHSEGYYDPEVLPDPFFDIALDGQECSRYLLSEMPKSTGFDGMDKPRMIFNDANAPSVGGDGTSRPLYRDVFLNVDKSKKDLDKLVIHELAHTMANHNTFVPDNHHEDFKWAEKVIGRYW